METVLHNQWGAIGKEEWNILLSKSPTHTIFQTFEWHAAWFQAYGMDTEGFLVVVKTEGRLAGVAPLVLCRRRGARVLEFAGDGRADYMDFLYPADRPEVVKEIISFLAASGNGWDRIVLNHIPGESPTHGLLAQACADLGLPTPAGASFPCPAALLDPGGECARSVTDRKSIQPYIRHFQSAEGYLVRHITDKAGMTAYFDAFFDQHVSRRFVTDTQSLFTEECNRAFYRDLVSRMSRAGWVVLTVVESEGIPIAFHFGFVYGGKLLYYKPSFEVSLSRYSPGMVLLKEVFQYAQAQKLHEFDFTIGDEPYKVRFANRIRHNQSVILFRSAGRRVRFKVRQVVRKFLLTRMLLRAARSGRDGVVRVVDSLRRHGLAGLSVRLLRLGWAQLFKKACVLVYSLEKGQCVPLPTPEAFPGMTIRRARMQDLLALADVSSPAEKRRETMRLQERFRAGAECFCAEHQGNILGTAWVKKAEQIFIAEAGSWLTVGPKSVTFFDCSTMPCYRNKGVYSCLLAYVVSRYRDQTKWIYCEADNMASRKGIERCFTQHKQMHLLKLFGCRFRWRDDPV